MIRTFFAGLTPSYILLVLSSVAPIFIVATIQGGLSTVLLIALSISLVICLIGSILVAGRIGQSLDRIEGVTQRFAEGDLTARVYPPRLSQLVDLSKSFNTMASLIQKRLERLRLLSAEQDAILRSMVEGVVTVDSDGRIKRVNQAARVLLDISLEECENRLVPEVIHHAGLQRVISRVMHSPEASSEVITINGIDEKVLEVYASPLIQEGSAPTGTLFVFHDKTQIQRLEHVRTDFVANVSHELRTPITSIKGFVETLLDGAMHEPESLKKFLSIIGRHADRLNEIVSDLLTLAQLEARGERGQLEFESCAVEEIVLAAVEACAHRASERGTLVHIQEAGGYKVMAKPNLIEQALVNLIDNAIKYSDPSSTVEIKVEQMDGFIRIAVVDTGPGIEKQHLTRLFERFYRIDQGRSRQIGGTGLGLSIVKHIAQVHGGRVEVASIPGSGTTFSLLLKA
ncbi:MAG: ATP-binding protein [Proteobacteria bacterium]|nr:ATP-binding protein [Pseudomonadota bacterium]